MLNFVRVFFLVIIIAISVFGENQPECVGNQCPTKRNIEDFCDLQVASTAKDLRDCDSQTQGAFKRALRILNFPCEANSPDLLLLKELIKEHPQVPYLNDENGRTLLMIAAEQGKEFPVTLLLQKGAPFDYQDKHGDTALLKAIEKNQLRVVILLLSFNANINLQNFKGFNAYQLACTLNDPKILIAIQKFENQQRQRVHSLTKKPPLR